MNDTTKLEIKSYLVNDDAMNKDVDTYVKLPDGSEWVFRTYLDKESSETVTMSFIRFSEGPDDPFDDTADEPPKEVVEAYQAEMSNIEELIRSGTLARQSLITANVPGGLTITAANPAIQSHTFTFHAGGKTLVVDSEGITFDGERVTGPDIGNAFRAFVESSQGASSAERLICVIPELIKLCLEQGHAIRHLDEEARYCELWTNDGGYIPDHRFATARSRIIANRPELWPVDKETENG